VGYELPWRRSGRCLSLCRRLRVDSAVPSSYSRQSEDLDRILGRRWAPTIIFPNLQSRELLARIKRCSAAASGGLIGPQASTSTAWRSRVDDRLSAVRTARCPKAPRPLTAAEFDLLQTFCEPVEFLRETVLLNMTRSRPAGQFDAVSTCWSVGFVAARQNRGTSIIKTLARGGYIFTPHVEPCELDRKNCQLSLASGASACQIAALILASLFVISRADCRIFL